MLYIHTLIFNFHNLIIADLIWISDTSLWCEVDVHQTLLKAIIVVLPCESESYNCNVLRFRYRISVMTRVKLHFLPFQ